MKKIFAAVLAIMMLLSLAACGGKTEPTQPAAQPTATEAGGKTQEANPVEGLFQPATSSATGAYATIKVSADVKMDDESAWLGLCPDGKTYITEEEADEVDVIWFNHDWREEGDPYVFACDFSSVEDGTYALVVATSDDASVGYVVLQLRMTKNGEKLTFDYSDARYNERPAQ